MTKYDNPEYLTELQTRAAQQAATGNYWAGKALALINELFEWQGTVRAHEADAAITADKLAKLRIQIRAEGEFIRSILEPLAEAAGLEVPKYAETIKDTPNFHLIDTIGKALGVDDIWAVIREKKNNEE